MKGLPLLLWLAATAAMADEAPVEKRAPEMRAVDRDAAYFAQLPCERVDKEPVHSAGEQHLLEYRRQQCQERYKAFFKGGPVR